MNETMSINCHVPCGLILHIYYLLLVSWSHCITPSRCCDALCGPSVSGPLPGWRVSCEQCPTHQCPQRASSTHRCSPAGHKSGLSILSICVSAHQRPATSTIILSGQHTQHLMIRIPDCCFRCIVILNK